MIDHSQYIRVEPINEIGSDAKIAMAKLFSEKQINRDNKLIDAYLDRNAKFNVSRINRAVGWGTDANR